MVLTKKKWHLQHFFLFFLFYTFSYSQNVIIFSCTKVGVIFSFGPKNFSPNDTSSPCKVMTEVKVVGLRVDPLNLCNLSVINKIKSCPLLILLIHYAQFERYASTMVHHLHTKESVQSYVQPIGCFFFMVVVLISRTTPSRFEYLLMKKQLI